MKKIVMNKTEKELAKTVQLIADATGVTYEEAVRTVENLLGGMLEILDKGKVKA